MKRLQLILHDSQDAALRAHVAAMPKNGGAREVGRLARAAIMTAIGRPDLADIEMPRGRPRKKQRPPLVSTLGDTPKAPEKPTRRKSNP